jgi:hypothetical protein
MLPLFYKIDGGRVDHLVTVVDDVDLAAVAAPWSWNL